MPVHRGRARRPGWLSLLPRSQDDCTSHPRSQHSPTLSSPRRVNPNCRAFSSLLPSSPRSVPRSSRLSTAGTARALLAGRSGAGRRCRSACVGACTGVACEGRSGEGRRRDAQGFAALSWGSNLVCKLMERGQLLLLLCSGNWAPVAASQSVTRQLLLPAFAVSCQALRPPDSFRAVSVRRRTFLRMPTLLACALRDAVGSFFDSFAVVRVALLSLLLRLTVPRPRTLLERNSRRS